MNEISRGINRVQRIRERRFRPGSIVIKERRRQEGIKNERKNAWSKREKYYASKHATPLPKHLADLADKVATGVGYMIHDARTALSKIAGR